MHVSFHWVVNSLTSPGPDMEHFNAIARMVVDPFLLAVNAPWDLDLSGVPRLLVVMRGLPGSDKTTLAETIAEYAGERGATTIICSANDYFMRDGVFEFHADDLGLAHESCFNRCLDGLNQARDQGPDILRSSAHTMNKTRRGCSTGRMLWGT
jgi:hypothetical protein